MSSAGTPDKTQILRLLRRSLGRVTGAARAQARFSAFEYQRHNARRLEHLASLRLELAGTTVLEVGAGTGDHSGYYFDRDCRVTITEPRRSNLRVLRQRYPDADIRVLDLEDPVSLGNAPFDVVHCYGVLYHLSDPAKALAVMAEMCAQTFLLETCVSFGDSEAVNLVYEDPNDPTQALSGSGCRPTRPWVFARLREHFEYVYVPTTQPNHPEFPIDWTAPDADEGLSRSVFVASRVPIDNPLLLTELPTYQERHA